MSVKHTTISLGQGIRSLRGVLGAHAYGSKYMTYDRFLAGMVWQMRRMPFCLSYFGCRYGTQFKFEKLDGSYEYSYDLRGWRPLPKDSWVDVNPGRVYVRAAGDNVSVQGQSGEGRIRVQSPYKNAWQLPGGAEEPGFRVQASGNIMSLLHRDFQGAQLSAENEGCFRGLFQGCEELNEAPLLLMPGPTCGRCFQGMFSGCSGMSGSVTFLGTAEQLSQGEGCFNGVFDGSGVEVVKLPEVPREEALSCAWLSSFGSAEVMFAGEEPSLSQPEGEGGGEAMAGPAELAPGRSSSPKPVQIAIGCRRPVQGMLPSLVAGDWDESSPDVMKQRAFAYEANIGPFEAMPFFIEATQPGRTKVSFTVGKSCSFSCRVAEYYELVVGADYDSWECWHSGDEVSYDLLQWQRLYIVAGMFDGENNKNVSFSSLRAVNADAFEEERTVDIGGNVHSVLERDFVNHTVNSIPSGFNFFQMFQGCKAIKSASRLLIDIGSTQYVGGWSSTVMCCRMFDGCTSMETGPVISLRSSIPFGESCLDGMFSGCTSLAYAPGLQVWVYGYGLDNQTLWIDQYFFSSMFQGCRSLVSAPQFTYVAEEGPSSSSGNEYDKFHIMSGKSIRSAFSYMFYGCSQLAEPIGNIRAVVGSKDKDHSVFQNMYSGCTSLVNAKTAELYVYDAARYEKAGFVTKSCFAGMYMNCTSLTQAPKLPATSLASYCYSGMFSGCTSMTAAPDLPATALARYCYSSMFRDCTSLTAAPELPATALASGCYSSMFSGCSNLTKAPELPATSLADSCYRGMFSGCTSMTAAPELHATQFDDPYGGYYISMFNGCESLVAVPPLPEADYQYHVADKMFYGCNKLAENPLQKYCAPINIIIDPSCATVTQLIVSTPWRDNVMFKDGFVDITFETTHGNCINRSDWHASECNEMWISPGRVYASGFTTDEDRCLSATATAVTQTENGHWFKCESSFDGDRFDPIDSLPSPSWQLTTDQSVKIVLDSDGSYTSLEPGWYLIDGDRGTYCIEDASVVDLTFITVGNDIHGEQNSWTGSKLIWQQYF